MSAGKRPLLASSLLLRAQDTQQARTLRARHSHQEEPLKEKPETRYVAVRLPMPLFERLEQEAKRRHKQQPIRKKKYTPILIEALEAFLKET